MAGRRVKIVRIKENTWECDLLYILKRIMAGARAGVLFFIADKEKEDGEGETTNKP